MKTRLISQYKDGNLIAADAEVRTGVVDHMPSCKSSEKTTTSTLQILLQSRSRAQRHQAGTML